MGRHVIGYEVQKVLAVVDWFERNAAGRREGRRRGLRRGRLLALYAAAGRSADRRRSGQRLLRPRQQSGPSRIYRNVWGLLREFGDAEIATLIAPRGAPVEHSARVPGITATRRGRICARQPFDSVRTRNTTPSSIGSTRARIPGPRLVHGETARPSGLGSAAGNASLSPASRRTCERSTRRRSRLQDFATASAPTSVSERQVRELRGSRAALLRASTQVREQFFLTR